MEYKKMTWFFRGAIEVEEYATGKFGAPGEKRKKREKPTPELMEKRNQHRKEKLARRRLRKYFRKNDYLVDLTYRRDARPGNIKQAKEQFRIFLRQVRREYRKRGQELRWLRNIEVGTKGAWHIHLCINRIPETDLILADAWKHGKVYFQLMYERGEFRELAAYITKTPKTDPRLKESSYSASRNMPLPPPDEKTYRRWKPWEKVKIPDGYYVDMDSFKEGTNPFTGRKYRIYTLLLLRQTE